MHNRKRFLQISLNLVYAYRKLSHCVVSLIFAAALCCVSESVPAQQADSLLTLLQRANNPVQKSFALAKYSFHFSSENADSAILLAKQSVQLAKNYNNDSALAEGYHAIGWCYFRLGKKDSAEYYLKKTRLLFGKLKDANNEGISLVNLSTVYNEYHDYPKSLACLIAARPLLENVKNESMLAYVDRTVGVVYRQQGLYKQSAEYFRSAIATFKRLNEPEHLADTYTSYGSVFWYQNAYDSALYYYRNAYNIFKRKNKLTVQLAYAAENVGLACYEKAERKNIAPWIDSARHYYTIALNTFTKLRLQENIEYEHINLGDILCIMKQYHASEIFLLQAFHYFDSTNNPNATYECLITVSKLYKETGDYKKAYEYTLLQQRYKDTVDKRNRTDSIAKMFAQYESEKKDRAIKLLNAQARLAQQKISEQRIIQIFSLVSVVLAIILFVVLINRSQIKQQLREVKVRNQLAGDLHDEVGSSLSSIWLLSKMALKNEEEAAENKSILEKISGNTKEVINKMSDIVWMMNPKYDEGENLREKLEQHIAGIKEIAPFKVNLDIAVGIDNIKFPMEIRKSIFLISKEAINNALKYSCATQLNINVSLVGNTLQMIIADNGKGFDEATIVKGNGLETMSLRAKNCKGKFELRSTLCKGVTIEVVIPLPRTR